MAEFASGSDDAPETKLTVDRAQAVKFAGKMAQDLLFEARRASDRLDAIIREAAEEGFSPASIASFGLSRAHVDRVIAGEHTWDIVRESN